MGGGHFYYLIREKGLGRNIEERGDPNAHQPAGYRGRVEKEVQQLKGKGGGVIPIFTGEKGLLPRGTSPFMGQD